MNKTSPNFEQMQNMTLAELKAWHDFCLSQVERLKNDEPRTSTQNKGR